MANEDTQFSERLIAYVFNYPEIYDKSHCHYKDTELKDNIWRSIAGELNSEYGTYLLPSQSEAAVILLFIRRFWKDFGAASPWFYSSAPRRIWALVTRQCCFMSLSALLCDRRFPIHQWLSEEIDDILSYGDSLYLSALEDGRIPDVQTLAINNLPSVVRWIPQSSSRKISTSHSVDTNQQG